MSPVELARWSFVPYANAENGCSVLSRLTAAAVEVEELADGFMVFPRTEEK
jgi:hypothetical protein